LKQNFRSGQSYLQQTLWFYLAFFNAANAKQLPDA
jgi:hypothetical protein